MRQVEGEALKKDFLARLDTLTRHLGSAKARAPRTVLDYKQRLQERIRELTDGLEMDPVRLSQEVALLAEKSDITEEIVRFESHIAQMEKLLQGSDAIGRKLDFLLQEMGREVNTLGSKSNDIAIGQDVIELKSELAKLRSRPRMSSDRLSMEGMFIAVTGPSGSGKTSVCKALLETFPQLRFSVSLTTRPPRPMEADGKDYHFVTEAEFHDRINRGDLIEWAENFGQLYGTSRETMEAALKGGHDLLLDVDTRGARALKRAWPGGIFVFVIPPSIKELERRLRGRGSETEETIRRRFDNALSEIREIVWYDYIIMNDKLDAAIASLRSIYVAETCRRERMMVKIKPFFERSGGN